MRGIKKLFKNNQWFFILFSIFIFSRLLGFNQLYHQDEYRWASIANPAFGDLLAPHPPLNKIALEFVGRVVGYDWLRLVPLLFGIGNFVLIYLVSLKLSGNRKIALIALGLFAVNVYSLIANLQIDIDGALLPFFVLSSFYCYWQVFVEKRKSFAPLLVLSVIGGFLAKLSFALFVGAATIDYAFRMREKRIVNIKKIGALVGGVFVIGAVFYFAYVFRDSVILKYAAHFKLLNLTSRSYADLIFKLFKSLIWLSPLLSLPALYGLFKKEIFIKYRFWFVYLFLNLLFYLVLFDFAKLTIERYFMFAIIPAILISAHVIHSLLPKFNKIYLLLGLLSFLLLFTIVLQVNQSIVPLNPKSTYLHKLISLDLNFLIPLTGGSGPIGFYVSGQFVFWIVVASIISIILAVLKKKEWLYIFLIFGLGYNIILSSEYLFGGVYGSVDSVTKESIKYIVDNKSIERVITYYDIGAYYLRLSDQYSSRFYTAPTRDYTKKLTEYRGHYLIVDFPAIDKKSQYWQLISRCKIEKEFTDKQVKAYIFDCTSLSPEKNK